MYAQKGLHTHCAHYNLRNLFSLKMRKVIYYFTIFLSLIADFIIDQVMICSDDSIYNEANEVHREMNIAIDLIFDIIMLF